MIRRFFISFGLVFFSVAVTLAAVESFFQLNVKYQWIAIPEFYPALPVHSKTEFDLNHLKGFNPKEVPDLPFRRDYNRVFDGDPDYMSMFLKGERMWTGELLMKPNGRFPVELRASISKKLLYKAVYSTDFLGRRQTTGQPLKAQEDIAVLGCSMVFGDGLNDSETLPSYLQALVPNQRVVNLAFDGADASTISYVLFSENYMGLRDIHPKVHFIYNYIDDHIRRAEGSLSWWRSNPYHRMRPYYALKEDSQIEYRGTMNDKYGIFAPLMWAATSSQFLNFFSVEFPPLDRKSVRLQSALIKNIKDQLKRRFPESDFTVVIDPSQLRFGPLLMEDLEKEGIRYLDFSSLNLTEVLHGNDRVGDGGHPSALANKLIAALIYKFEFQNQGK